MCPEPFLFFKFYLLIYFIFLWFLFVFSDLFWSPLFCFLSDVLLIYNYICGFLSFLVSSWFCPLESNSRGTVGRRITKVRCLFLCISSREIDYAWLIPSVILSLQLSLCNYKFITSFCYSLLVPVASSPGIFFWFHGPHSHL